ncbi:hypothetical protein GH808_08575 [Acetobacterium fimetarium]|uniref:Glycosyltransferase RgtA/B/C/D-like domain-containing protein n=1 Tax=Acetobacterium fimetarium TaxID=52691 RepID=A0ABR6WV63_9FIRM|nr:hypothetical protein [Acetobacterium fimetarium]MBC3804486.1 hypothetical protein [Acetobacterium fimetarium]
MNKKAKILSRDIENKILFCVLGFLIAILLCGLIYYWKNEFQNIVVIGNQIAFSFFAVCVFMILILTLYFIKMNQQGKSCFVSTKILFDFFIDYRYRIAAIVFVILVVLGINFSSLAFWETTTHEESHSVIFGQERPIRSDEWLVETPWVLSQYNEGFPTENEDIRVDGQNMLFMSTKTPINHISTIGNPYNWGYFFLSIEQGYAWHWVLKLLLLLLFSYEFLYIITKESRYVAFIGAFWIAFSPTIAWWYDTSVIEIVIAFQALFVAVFYYFRVSRVYQKILLLAMVIVFGLNFILDLYPAFQIVLGYVFLGLFSYLVCKNYKKIRKLDIAFISLSIIFVIVVVAVTIIPSISDITIMMSTSYPGSRMITGGGMSIFDLSRYLYNWLIPHVDVPPETLLNNCIASAYVTFIPASLVIILKRWKEKKYIDNNYLKIFIAFYIMFALWILLPFPEFFAKYTLLYMVTPQMSLMGAGLLGVYISCIVISQLNESQGFSKKGIIAFLSFLGCYFLLALYFDKAISYLGIIGTGMTIMIFLMANYFFIAGKKYPVLICVCFISVIPGFFVNPINVGLAPIYETALAKSIQAVVEEDPEGLWIGYDSITLPDYILAQGGKVLNSVHYYPNNRLWAQISNNTDDYAIYNRFAHIEIEFNDLEETKFELIGTDHIKIILSINDLEKLDVKYIVSYNPLEKFSNQNISFIKQSQNDAGTIFIYEVIYNN